MTAVGRQGSAERLGNKPLGHACLSSTAVAAAAPTAAPTAFLAATTAASPSTCCKDSAHASPAAPASSWPIF